MAGRIVKGVSWSAVQQFSTQIIQFVITIILARLLTPTEFGVVAASTIVIAILQVINEGGFTSALMQKLDRDDLDFNTVFFINILWGGFLYFLVVISSHLWALIFKTPELEIVIKWLGLNLIIESFMVVQRTKLFINVDFKTWTKASVSGTLVGGTTGIVLAYRGWGVYALVAQSLISSFLTVLFVWILVKWVPKLEFSFQRFKRLFSYAYKLTGARFINSLFNEIYASVIALVYNPTDLALFNRAKSFQYLSSNNLVQVVQRVSVPLMCEVQASQAELRKVTLRFINNTIFIIAPLIVLLFTLAKPLIIILLTDKWIESVPILRIICFAGFFYVISAFNENLFNAVGKTSLALKSEIIKKIVMILIISFAVILKNFNLLIWSFVVCALIECIIDTCYTKPIIGAGLLEQIKGVKGIILISIVMGLLIYSGSLICSNMYIQLFGLGSLGLAAYIAMSVIFNIGPTRQILKSKFK